jgi:hypothetical protein
MRTIHLIACGFLLLFTASCPGQIQPRGEARLQQRQVPRLHGQRQLQLPRSRSQPRRASPRIHRSLPRPGAPRARPHSGRGLLEGLFRPRQQPAPAQPRARPLDPGDIFGGPRRNFDRNEPRNQENAPAQPLDLSNLLGGPRRSFDADEFRNRDDDGDEPRDQGAGFNPGQPLDDRLAGGIAAPRDEAGAGFNPGQPLDDRLAGGIAVPQGEADAGSPAPAVGSGDGGQGDIFNFSLSLTLPAPGAPAPATRWIRVHAIRTANDRGHQAATVSAAAIQAQVAEANRALAGSGIQLQFDPTTDLEDRRSTLLNQDCTLIGPDLLDPQWSPAQADTSRHHAARLQAASRFPGQLVVFYRWGTACTWDAARQAWLPGPSPAAFGGLDLGYVALPASGGATASLAGQLAR